MGITEGTLLKRGKRIHWKYRLDGKTVWESLGVSSMAEARHVRQMRIKEYHENRFAFLARDKNPSLEQFEKEYFKWAAENKRPRSVEAEAYSWAYLKDYVAPVKMGDVTPQKLERLKSQLLKSGKRGKPLSKKSINNILTDLHTIYQHAIRMKVFSGQNPLKDVSHFKLPKKKPDFLTDDEIGALLLEGEKYSENIHIVLLLGIFLGLRKNELINSRWEWFDFGEKIMTVRHHDGFELKDYEEREIPLTDGLIRELEKYRKQDGFLLLSNRRSDGKSNYRYEPKKGLHVVAVNADVPRLTFHLMRHTFGSQHAIKGTSIYKISKWMGHSTVNVTAKHYAGLQCPSRKLIRVCLRASCRSPFVVMM
jgi:integrase